MGKFSKLPPPTKEELEQLRREGDVLAKERAVADATDFQAMAEGMVEPGEELPEMPRDLAKRMAEADAVAFPAMKEVMARDDEGEE